MAALMKGDKHPAVGMLQDALNRYGAFPTLPPTTISANSQSGRSASSRRISRSCNSPTAALPICRRWTCWGIRLGVERLVWKAPLQYNPSQDWAAYLDVRRVKYSDYGFINTDPGQVATPVQYVATGFVLSNYRHLIGGRITVSKNGVYTFHGVDDPDRVEVKKNECAALVQAFGVTRTGTWRRGPRVKGNNILPGTVVATMRDDKYYSDYSGRSHVAIFESQTSNGICTIDQWNGSDIHREFRPFKPEDLGDERPFKKGQDPYGWIGDADEYYVVYSTEPTHRLKYE